MIKGPSFREQNDIDWNKIKSILLDALCAYKMQWIKREHFDIRILNEWQSTLDELLVNRINVLKRKKQAWKKQQVLKRNKHLEYLKQFQQQYVLVPADNASNNIIVVCKKYYVDVLVKELLNAGQPSTYVDSGDTYDRLVWKHIWDLKRWNICIPPVMEELPTLYWMPKLHNNLTTMALGTV